MIVVSDTNTPVFPAAVGSAVINAQDGGEPAFQQMFDLYAAGTTLSGATASALPEPEIPFKDGGEDSAQVDLECDNLPMLAPFPQFIISLSLPSPAMPAPTVESAAYGKPTPERETSIDVAAAGTVAQILSGETLAQTSRPAEPDPQNTEALDAGFSNAVLEGPDAKPQTTEQNPASQAIVPNASSTGGIAQATVATIVLPTVANADQPTAASLPVESDEQPLPPSAEKTPQTAQSVPALTANSPVIVEYPKSSLHFSAAENIWRQKWAGNDEAPATVDDSITNQTIIADDDNVPNPQSPLLLPNKAPTPSAQIALHYGQPGLPTAPAVSHSTATANSSLASTVAEKMQRADQPDLFAVGQAFKSIELDSLSGPSIGPSDMGQIITLQKPMIHSAIFQSPAPSSAPVFAAISSRIVEMSKIADNGPVALSLAPEELGKLTISIKQDGNFVHVTLTADRPETLDLMRRNANDLIADLRQTGFSGASLSFGQGQKDQNPSFQHADQSHLKNQHSPQSLLTETKPTAPSRSRIGAGVDLRF